MIQEKQETSDEVLQEVRAIKDELAKSLDYDIDRILEVAPEETTAEWAKGVAATSAAEFMIDL